MPVKLALGSSAAKLTAIAAMAGLAGGGYTLASAASRDSGHTDSSVLAQSAHPSKSHTPDADESSEAATEGTDETSAAASGTPTPNLNGLCNAFRAHKVDNPDGWKQSAAFQVLVKAAGGDDNASLEAYCLTLVGPARTPEHGKPTDLPGKPTDHPGNGDHSGRPTSSHSPDADESESAEAPEPSDTAPDLTPGDAGKQHGLGRH